LGFIYSSLDENEKAKNIYEKTISLKPNYYEARLGLAQTYAKLNNTEKAKEQYYWILDNLNSEDEDVKSALNELK
jgi:Tfp pilus assembly protein PilF